jgi:uncharacterized membrane protein
LTSLHFGWTLLVGVTVAAASRRWIAYAFAVSMPAAMTPLPGIVEHLVRHDQSGLVGLRNETGGDDQ